MSRFSGLLRQEWESIREHDGKLIELYLIIIMSLSSLTADVDRIVIFLVCIDKPLADVVDDSLSFQARFGELHDISLVLCFRKFCCIYLGYDVFVIRISYSDEPD